jgi:hypothetical protein
LLIAAIAMTVVSFGYSVHSLVDRIQKEHLIRRLIDSGIRGLVADIALLAVPIVIVVMSATLLANFEPTSVVSFSVLVLLIAAISVATVY